MKSILAFAIAASLLAATPARAEKVDMAKIKCDDLAHLYLPQFVVIGAWLSGYYNAKNNRTEVDTEQLTSNTQKVLDFCKSNPDVTVMQAVERLNLEAGKTGRAVN